MKGISEKVYLSLKMPTEEVPVSDQKRIKLALEELGYEHVTMSLSAGAQCLDCFSLTLCTSHHGSGLFLGQRSGY